MRSTITTETLDRVAADLDPIAREMAHADVVGSDTSAADYAVIYLRALAEVCGAIAASQCAAGEAWDPEEMLDGDVAAIRESAELVEIELSREDWRELGKLYRAPSDRAFRAAEVGVPDGRYVVCRRDGSLSCGLREALCTTEAEGEAALATLATECGYDDHEVRPRLVHHV